MKDLYDALRRSPTFAALTAHHPNTTEGNLLEITDETTALAQLATLQQGLRLAGEQYLRGHQHAWKRWAARTPTRSKKAAEPHPELGLRVLEIGTNKGLFGLAVPELTPIPVHLTTIDRDPASAGCVPVLRAANRLAVIEFIEGESPQVLNTLAGPFHFAWVDGYHDTDHASQELEWCADRAIPVIAVDDTRFVPELARVVEDFVARHQLYRLIPALEEDARGAVLLVHVTVPE